MKQIISVLITDLDNTLFDWFDIWYHPFSAMLDQIEAISGVERARLISEIKKIHERHRTSEYAFLIEEIPSLQARHGAKGFLNLYAPAIQRYREVRAAHMRLYPDVGETLEKIRSRGTIVAGYTESMAFYTNYRVRKLGLDGLLDFLYSPEDHGIPEDMPIEALRAYPPEHYEFKHTRHRYTPRGELKPNPDVLLSIVKDIRLPSERCLYVGDSLMKDIHMANEAKITSAYAKYGIASNRPEYELLRQVTHWTDADVQREKLHNTDPSLVKPERVLEHSFGELLEYFEFRALG